MAAGGGVVGLQWPPTDRTLFGRARALRYRASAWRLIDIAWLCLHLDEKSAVLHGSIIKRLSRTPYRGAGGLVSHVAILPFGYETGRSAYQIELSHVPIGATIGRAPV